MRKFFKLLIPVITGVLAILGILKVDDLIKDMISANFNFNTSDMGNIVFYYVLIPVALLLALIIHWIFILPVIRKLDVKPTFWRLRLMHYIILISFMASAIVGYIFWRKTESVNDVVVAVITSFLLFFVYFIITVLLSKGIDHFDDTFNKKHLPEKKNPDDHLST
jgi:nucleoside recognition membrane protein YjiH